MKFFDCFSAATSFGVLYVGWLSAHIVLLRELPWQVGRAYQDGASFVLITFQTLVAGM